MRFCKAFFLVLSFIVFLSSCDSDKNSSPLIKLENNTLFQWELKENDKAYTFTALWDYSLKELGSKLANDKAFREKFHSEWHKIPYLKTHGFVLNTSNLLQGKLTLELKSYKYGKRDRPYNAAPFKAYLEQKVSGPNLSSQNRFCDVGIGYRGFWSRDVSQGGNFLLIPTQKVRDLYQYSQLSFDNEVDSFWKRAGELILLFVKGKAPGFQPGTYANRTNITLGAHTGSEHGQSVFHFHLRLQKV